MPAVRNGGAALLASEERAGRTPKRRGGTPTRRGEMLALALWETSYNLP
jgi:hypothetical protein